MQILLTNDDGIEAPGLEVLVVFCPLDHSQLPVNYKVRDWQFQYRGVYCRRDRKHGTDVDVCFSGGIAVTQVMPPPDIGILPRPQDHMSPADS